MLPELWITLIFSHHKKNSQQVNDVINECLYETAETTNDKFFKDFFIISCFVVSCGFVNELL